MKQEDWVEEGCSFPMTGEVSKRIHDRISFDKGCWLINDQEIQEDHVIGRTI